MKKITLAVMAIFAFGFANGQAKEGQVSKGKWLIEVNTGFGENVGNTSLSLTSSDGTTAYNIGAEGGYFIKDNLAIKLGLGYGDDGIEGNDTPIAYKIGAKYYFKKMIPIELSYNGVGFGYADANPTYLGFQAGYALFLGKNVSIEPGLRYNKSMNTDYYDDNFQFNIGFALHF
ncbi:MAG: hypothetical protein Q8R22_14955 [Flavobacterium sp.]|jgi:hypothetical protein|uniref:Outer membrane protein beta-barrel domain-containing protein n=1 Tax=Flavobacterium sandaracinum TaxID=2541733 RepID=A0A4R5CVE8_9FLAO|nr:MULTISPECIES: hypothetical protein [Flavobacterium]MDP3682126.1 hypothetical protein [Flavobacterium sp.]MDZ4330731.1 hypothetical protein [Flavobacterium sp.]TDE02981.1 hypothetical protein E0F91_11375 [Flavobacterium sandaracinum]